MKNLIKSTFLISAFLGTILTVASCHKDTNQYTMGNQDFVTRASSSNMFEIAAGALAVHNSTNADVQAYGSQMVSEHGQTATEMSALARQKGLTIPTNMLPQQQTDLSTLAGLSGAAFNKQFAAIMVISHEQTINLFQLASSSSGVPDKDLRNFAIGKLPNLNQHLQAAQQLQTKVGQ